MPIYTCTIRASTPSADTTTALAREKERVRRNCARRVLQHGRPATKTTTLKQISARVLASAAVRRF